MAAQPRIRAGGLAAVVGGLLWVAFGVFEMLAPWGAASVYRDELGYAPVIDAGLYTAYTLPGGLSLLLIALGLLLLVGPPVGRVGRVGVVLAYCALAFAVFSLAGVVVRFEPLFVAALTFGTVALGAATVAAALGAGRSGAEPGWRRTLLALGLWGLLLIPLRPLVYALEVVPTPIGAAVLALFGVGWAAFGIVARSGGFPAASSDARAGT